MIEVDLSTWTSEDIHMIETTTIALQVILKILSPIATGEGIFILALFSLAGLAFWTNIESK